jgi:hypothetical protein
MQTLCEICVLYCILLQAAELLERLLQPVQPASHPVPDYPGAPAASAGKTLRCLRR